MGHPSRISGARRRTMPRGADTERREAIDRCTRRLARQFLDWVDGHRETVSRWNQTIWHFGETAWREYRSAAWYVDLLRAQGFDVEAGSGGMPTGFLRHLDKRHRSRLSAGMPSTTACPATARLLAPADNPGRGSPRMPVVIPTRTRRWEFRHWPGFWPLNPPCWHTTYPARCGSSASPRRRCAAPNPSTPHAATTTASVHSSAFIPFT